MIEHNGLATSAEITATAIVPKCQIIIWFKETKERGSDKRVLRAFKQFLCNHDFENV